MIRQVSFSEMTADSIELLFISVQDVDPLGRSEHTDLRCPNTAFSSVMCLPDERARRRRNFVVVERSRPPLLQVRIGERLRAESARSNP